jgi:hypothetical protein
VGSAGAATALAKRRVAGPNRVAQQVGSESKGRPGRHVGETRIMTEAVVVAVVVLLGGAVYLATRRAKRRRNFNPDDIYPHW